MIGRGCVKFWSDAVARRYHADMSERWGDRSNGGARGMAIDGCHVALDTLGSDDDIGAMLYTHAEQWAMARDAGPVKRVHFATQDALLSFAVRLIE